MDGRLNTPAGTAPNHQYGSHVGQASTLLCSGCGAQNSVMPGTASSCEYCGTAVTNNNIPNTSAPSAPPSEYATVRPISGPIHSYVPDQPINLNVTVAAPTHQPQTQHVHTQVQYIQPQVQYVQPQSIRPASDKSRGVALALCIFLGFFGGHMFYVGKSGMGVFYILTLGGFIYGVIIDFFRILSGSFKDCDGIPLRSW